MDKKAVQEWMDRMSAPIKHEVDELIWSSYFRVNERIANGFRRKRAFLVGDSAHCHSPVGGQGLNTSLQDAFNLCWKLSNVLNGVVSDPDKILDSYSNEREPIAKAVIQTTGNTTEVGLANNLVLQAIRTTAMKLTLMVPFIKRIAYTNLMQLRIAIDPQTSGILGSSDKGLIKTGEFLPHCGVLRKSIIPRNEIPKTIQRYRFRDLFVRMEKYTAVYLGACPSSVLPNLDLLKKFWIDTRQLPIRRVVIQSSWHNRQSGFPSWINEDEKDEAKQSFYIEEAFDQVDSVSYHTGLYSISASYFAGSKPYSAVLIVRPDLHIAHAKLVQNEADLDAALDFFSSMFA
ncbi:FAD binding domain-containing protein [Blakeslea trispora]|nr:FAD binding domain-containing protein [Blakeslea trispora]